MTDSAWRTVGVSGLVLMLASACGGASLRGSTPARAQPFTGAARFVPSAATLEHLAEVAVGLDARAAAEATGRLRSHGQPGLDALLAVAKSRGVLAALGGGARPAHLSEADVERFRTAIDRTARQRDGYSSRLFWHTDLDNALVEAKALGRPVLSLRLLGNLDEELSCANSRFFRVALYANAELSGYLRDHYVLHWQSVRPAPKITIDFGDGRKLERTITGNSIHYVLAPDGQVVDALPGLYGPLAFRSVLGRAEATVQQALRLPGDQQAGYVAWYQQTEAGELLSTWSSDLARLGIPAKLTMARAPFGNLPSAADAAPRAMSKAIPEIPMVVQVLPSSRTLLAKTSDTIWQKLGALHAEQARLDAASRALILRKTAVDLQARSATPRPLGQKALERLVQRFETSIAEDTVRNEFEFRAMILGWLSERPPSGDRHDALDALNRRVYTELFLTPDQDRWLGLVEPDVFTGIANQGLISDAGKLTAQRPR
jgi:hypothetical protein